MTRFTKRHFVWHKNTQKLEDSCIIPFLLLSLNMDSVFKFLQRPPNASQFSFWVTFARHLPVWKKKKSKHRACKCDVFVWRGFVIRNKICDEVRINRIYVSKFLKKNESWNRSWTVASISKRIGDLDSAWKTKEYRGLRMFGYFCVEQTSILWIVMKSPKNEFRWLNILKRIEIFSIWN